MQRARSLDFNSTIVVSPRLALQTGLMEEIDERVSLLNVHLPYHESDHVLNIA